MEGKKPLSETLRDDITPTQKSKETLIGRRTRLVLNLIDRWRLNTQRSVSILEGPATIVYICILKCKINY